ncbi:hypothetical protein HPB52_008124 [Rhipicephalus sanguineus]|uniref:CCHC-type domain-containing protein n=1 Tax=Rhipicephalus sanguineus TaxID=34632 RepID=A0A9D4SZN6_RHISA|nr:hypothetical protein HPB52_008124 [Rhipicephalus sanguineus]
MPETIAVDGTEAIVEDLSDDGWITAYGNRRRQDQMKNTALPSGAAEKKGRYNRTPSTFQRVVVGSRLPRMPEDYFRVIVRPKGGLNVSRVDHFALSKSLIMAAALTDKQAEQDSVYLNKTQNIIVISTPMIANAKAYAGCSLYRRQVDICYACGQVGHRADVCHKSTEEKEKCHNCGLSIPSDTRETHSCTPKCKLCGGAHITGDRSCKKKYHVPYIVRKRRRDRRSRSRADPEEDTEAAMRSRSRGRSRQRGGTGGPARSQSRSRSRSKAKLTWADKVRGGSGSSGGNIGEAGHSPRPSTPVRGKAQSEQNEYEKRILALERENRELKNKLEELMTLMAIKVSEPQNSTVKTPTPYPQPPAIVSTQRNAHKRRAVAAVSDEEEDDLSDGMSDVSEAPSNVSAVEGTSTSRRDKRRNTTFNTISANDQLHTRNPQNKHQLQQQEPLYPVREQ